MQLYIQKNDELENIDSLINSLSEYRKEQFKKFKCNNDKLNCLAADYLIKKYVSTKPVSKNEYGKIYIKGEKKFNISHSEEYTIIATDDNDIGCDIEKVRDINVKEIAQRAFHEKEIEQLGKNNYDLKTFYKLWTIKESYMKMLGYGFSLDSKSFFVDLEKLYIDGKTIIEIFEKPDDYIISVVGSKKHKKSKMF